MKTLWATVIILVVTGQNVAADAAPLAAGTKATLRVRQVIPSDGLSRGERLLNSLPPLKPGDAFTAELIDPPGRPAVILAGTVSSITPPGRFGKPGKVTVQLARPVGPDDERPAPWWLAIEDQRFTSAHRRRLIASLFMLEGFGMGAAIGAQLDRGKAETTLAGGGAGLLLGVIYASFQPGQAASLEPGDTLDLVIGGTCVKKLPPEMPPTIYPAQEPKEEEKSHKDKRKKKP